MLRYFRVLLSISFAVHWVWDMAQMLAYDDMSRQPWQQTILPCTISTVGDVLITLLAFSFIAVVRRNLRWSYRPEWRDYALAGVFGAGIAVAVEKVAIAARQWSYTDAMPVLPVIQVGLLPLLQLTLLIPLTFWAAARFIGGQPQPLLSGLTR